VRTRSKLVLLKTNAHLQIEKKNRSEKDLCFKYVLKSGGNSSSKQRRAILNANFVINLTIIRDLN